MKDEKRVCARCNHEHDWGILRYSPDNVPLYGPRECVAGVPPNPSDPYTLTRCRCHEFMQADPDAANLPAMTQGEIKELWADTAFLNVQVPTAVRVMIRKIMAIGKGDKTVGFWTKHFGKSQLVANIMERQWPEFMGLMISQLTDIRGAMVRDDSKFAHLVAHTDEIVESMRGVVQLSERLTGVNQRIDDVNERLDRIEGMLKELLPKEDPLVEEGRVIASEVRRIWQSGNNAPLRDEAIVTDGTPVDPDKENL